jgi:GTP cyclohydrolase III
MASPAGYGCQQACWREAKQRRRNAAIRFAPSLVYCFIDTPLAALRAASAMLQQQQRAQRAPRHVRLRLKRSPMPDAVFHVISLIAFQF